MGKLVQFDKRGRHPKARPLVKGNAQIFLFTGVRYERRTAAGRPGGFQGGDGRPGPRTRGAGLEEERP